MSPRCNVAQHTPSPASKRRELPFRLMGGKYAPAVRRCSPVVCQRDTLHTYMCVGRVVDVGVFGQLSEAGASVSSLLPSHRHFINLTFVLQQFSPPVYLSIVNRAFQGLTCLQWSAI